MFHVKIILFCFSWDCNNFRQNRNDEMNDNCWTQDRRLLSLFVSSKNNFEINLSIDCQFVL